MTRLIVTADDLGLHPGMTAGAVRAHREGIVTACSISPCGRDLDATTDAVGAERHLDAGIHFTLVEERPVLPPGRIGSLVGSDGRFVRKWPQFTARFLAGKIARVEIEAELRAQIALLRARGIEVIHANSHQHLHLLPSLHALVIRLAADEGIAYVRTVKDRALRLWSPRALLFAALGVLSRSRGTLTNDHTIGVTDAGHLDEDRLISLLGRVRGVTELVTHPGIDDAALSRSYDWDYHWDRETEALTSPRVREAIAHHGIELIGIRDLIDQEATAEPSSAGSL